MKVTFIFHSSFAVELERHVLIFDYYGEGKLPEIPAGKKIYFLNSHGHQDHFRKEILKLKETYPSAEYLLSYDIKAGDHVPWIHRLKARTETKIGELTVRTLKSTDLGVAFLVEAEGKKLYHGGDLNWWHWEGEEKSWNNNMAANYKKEIDAIDGQYFDAAFVPLDPRLEAAYDLGMNYYLEHTQNKAVFPMHCWEKYEICRTYEKELSRQSFCRHAEAFYVLEYPGQQWEI